MHLIIDLPLSYLENDVEIVEHWLNNYADGIRLTNLNGEVKLNLEIKL
jgi:hypothetical protein